jgi:hypothetical protein
MGVCLSWQDAVLAGHLKSNTYQRLMVAIIAKSTLYMGAFLLVRHTAATVAAAAGQQQDSSSSSRSRVCGSQSTCSCYNAPCLQYTTD